MLNVVILHAVMLDVIRQDVITLIVVASIRHVQSQLILSFKSKTFFINEKSFFVDLSFSDKKLSKTSRDKSPLGLFKCLLLNLFYKRSTFVALKSLKIEGMVYTLSLCVNLPLFLSSCVCLSM
jgi:hypothetical protein